MTAAGCCAETAHPAGATSQDRGKPVQTAQTPTFNHLPTLDAGTAAAARAVDGVCGVEDAPGADSPPGDVPPRMLGRALEQIKMY